MSVDVDDDITWLGRSDQSNPQIQALMSTAQGRRAVRQGNDKDASQFFRQAITAYDRQPINPAALNNSAGVCLTLYHLTGDRRDLDQSLARYEKAHSLAPSDALLVHNLARSLLKAGLAEVLGDTLDLGLLRQPGSIGLLGHVCRDAAEERRYMALVRGNAKMAKARAVLERSLILSPKNVEAYASLADLALLERDETALRQLLERLDSVELDLGDELRKTREYYAGTKLLQEREEFTSSLKRAQEALERARAKSGSTLAFAAVSRAGLTLHGIEVGVPADLDTVLRLSEEAHAAASSRATYEGLISVLFYRVSSALAAQDKAFAQLVSRTQRSCDSTMVLLMGLAVSPDRCRIVLGTSDCRRLVQLEVELAQKFPEHATPSSWLLLRTANRPEATSLGQRILADKVGDLGRRIGLRCSPLATTNALECYWYEQLAGHEEKGRAILARLDEYKVPLPVEMPSKPK
jgi:tetratricopeptide (TPR) repeat protein